MSARIDAVYGTPESFVAGLKALKEAGVSDYHAFGPSNFAAVEELLPKQMQGSPVRWFTVIAGIVGCAFTFWMCIATANVYRLIVGGKHPAALIPYCVPAYELTILFGAVTTFAIAVLLFFNRWGLLLPPLGQPRERRFWKMRFHWLGLIEPPSDYRPEYSGGKFGISVAPTEGRSDLVDLLRQSGAEEIHEPSDAA